MRSLDELIDVDGKVVVVTGAGSGIGRAIALGLAGLGAVVHGADVSAEGLAGTSAAAADGGVRFHAVECDVADEEAVEALFDAVVAADGVPDVAFANAGIAGPFAPVEELRTEAWHRTIAVNLDGAFFVARAAYRRMLARRRGKIVLTSSTWASVPPPTPASPPTPPRRAR